MDLGAQSRLYLVIETFFRAVALRVGALALSVLAALAALAFLAVLATLALSALPVPR